jgi:hypothetical protein
MVLPAAAMLGPRQAIASIILYLDSMLMDPEEQL